MALALSAQNLASALTQHPLDHARGPHRAGPTQVTVVPVENDTVVNRQYKSEFRVLTTVGLRLPSLSALTSPGFKSYIVS